MSSPYGSLQEGLSKVTLETSFPGQGKPLISDIVIYFDPIQAICKNSVKIETRIFNNLQTPISILSLAGTTSQGGKVVADFNTKLSSPLVAQPGGQVSDYSVMIDNINLTQGPTASAGLLFTTSQGLDVVSTLFPSTPPDLRLTKLYPGHCLFCARRKLLRSRTQLQTEGSAVPYVHVCALGDNSLLTALSPQASFLR